MIVDRLLEWGLGRFGTVGASWSASRRAGCWIVAALAGLAGGSHGAVLAGVTEVGFEVESRGSEGRWRGEVLEVATGCW